MRCRVCLSDGRDELPSKAWSSSFDSVITGGIDRNMGPSTFVKFCKIGALSATGTRPYAKAQTVS